MEPRLARTVWVTPPGGVRRVRLPAGSNPPEWAWPLITNPAAWAVAPVADVTDVDGPPPLHGKGSGRDAWASYAESHGVHVAPEATRADIITDLDHADIRTE